MNKPLQLISLLLIFFSIETASSATWEKLYSKKSTDCFRHVQQLSDGSFFLAGYTANFTPHDTDGLAVKMSALGDTLWTFIYNGPGSSADGFFKGKQTLDGGYILCGYSASFGNGENALFVKLNSSGVLQWVKSWGGAGNERAEDIIQLADGNYVSCGSTGSSPAVNTDAFILKFDGSGNIIWSKNYGTSGYDDAASLKLLPDGGFLIGGQGNGDFFIVRTNSAGNFIWSHQLGTAGVDIIKCIESAQGGSGFILTGTTTGLGAGGEDAYIIRTDSGGVKLWEKVYGGPLDDGIHRISKTSDGNYIYVGTTRTGPWANPNIWLVKIDPAGIVLWEKFFGGNYHDHGYTGVQTSDGGFIVAGHTHSFTNNENLDDAIVIKTDANGDVSNTLSYTTVRDIIAPISTTGCASGTSAVTLQLANFSVNTVPNIPVTIVITGPVNQTLTGTYASSVARDGVVSYTLTATANLSLPGNYHFHCYTGNAHDVYPAHNYFDKTITIGAAGTAGPVVTDDARCGAGSVTLSATSSFPVNWYSSHTSTIILHTGPTYTTPSLSATENYYATTNNGTCESARVQVHAVINPAPANPVTTGASLCGSGVMNLSATDADPVSWFAQSSGGSALATGNSFTTPSLSATTTYYAEAANSTCKSSRIAAVATVIAVPAVPVAADNSRCDSGTVTLNATSPATVKWYLAATGGSSVVTGNSFTTPFIHSTTTYFVLSDNLGCKSARVPVVATINLLPAAPLTASSSRCGNGTVDLSATSSDTIKWYDVASGGSHIATGAMFTTAVLTSTHTFYASSDNGTCKSARIAAVATINPLPAAPAVSDVSHCGAGSLTLNAVATGTVKWFDADTAGNLLHTGNSFMTPSLSASEIYYVDAEDGICSSERILVNAIINNVPADPIVTTSSNCGGGSVVLSASSSDTILWFDNSAATASIFTGNSFITPFINSTTDYYATAFNGFCGSAVIPVTATINFIPVINLGADTIYVGGSSYMLDAGPGYPSYLWSTSDITQQLNVVAPGSYCVTVTDANTCTGSDCVFVDFTTGISNLTADNFSIYSSEGKISVELPGLFSNAELFILDVSGKLIYSSEIHQQQELIELPFLSKGIYVAKLQSSGKQLVKRFLLY